MELTREQKKKKLEAVSAGLIEALLSWEEANQAPNLTPIEEEVLKLRQCFGEEMASVVVEGQAQRVPVAGVNCPQCGKAMGYKGEKKKEVESRVGGLRIQRGNYHCADCESGLFPPRRPIGIGQWRVE